MTVDTSVEAFERYMAKVRSKSTSEKYGDGAAKLVEFCQQSGYLDWSELPSNILSEFSAYLVDSSYAPASVQLNVYAGRKYLNWLLGHGIKIPVIASPDLPKITYKVKDLLPPDALNRYFEMANELLNEPYRTAVMLMPCSGLRVSEMAYLELSAISKERVKLEKDEYKDTLVLKFAGKGGDERIVPLFDEGVKILTQYLSGWRKGCAGHWVFPNNARGRKHIHERCLRDALVKLRPALGQDFTPHTMRRTYLVTMWRRGVSEAVLAKIAGHKSVQTLFKHYLALDSQDLLKAFHGSNGRDI